MQKETKMRNFTKEIRNAHKKGRKFSNFHLIDSIEEALGENDRKKLKKIYYDHFEENKHQEGNSIWNFSIQGEEFWQVFQNFLGPY